MTAAARTDERPAHGMDGGVRQGTGTAAGIGPSGARQNAGDMTASPAASAEGGGASPLMQVVLGFLTPLLLASGIADARLARLAAQQAIAAHGPEGDLMDIAQLVGFALASLDNLRLSASPEASMSMKLRLRANANALRRQTDRQRQARPPAPVQPTAPPDDTAVQMPPAPAEGVPAAGAQAADAERQRKGLWARAMTDVAAECARKLVKLPPDQRRAEKIRIAALQATARQLKHDHAEANVIGA